MARFLVTAAIVIASSAPALARDGAADRPGLLKRITSGRLSIGVRESRWWLADSRRYGENGLDAHSPENFIGSLWGLDPKQGFLPCPFFEYRIVSAFGVGAAYDQAWIKTLDWADKDAGITAGDGDLRIRGYQAYGFGRLRNRTRVTPSIRVGYSRYWSAFFETPGWAAGGKSFEVQDTRGWFAGAGAAVSVWRHVAVEASYEHLWLRDVRAKAGVPGTSRRKGAFPVRSDVLRVGFSYGF